MLTELVEPTTTNGRTQTRSSIDGGDTHGDSLFSMLAKTDGPLSILREWDQGQLLAEIQGYSDKELTRFQTNVGKLVRKKEGSAVCDVAVIGACCQLLHLAFAAKGRSGQFWRHARELGYGRTTVHNYLKIYEELGHLKRSVLERFTLEAASMVAATMTSTPAREAAIQLAADGKYVNRRAVLELREQFPGKVPKNDEKTPEQLGHESAETNEDMLSQPVEARVVDPIEVGHEDPMTVSETVAPPIGGGVDAPSAADRELRVPGAVVQVWITASKVDLVRLRDGLKELFRELQNEFGQTQGV